MISNTILSFIDGQICGRSKIITIMEDMNEKLYVRKNEVSVRNIDRERDMSRY